MENRGLAVIKGAGDLASGIALRLHRCGYQIIMTEIAVPTTVRRTVAFSPAVYLGETQVEDVTGVRCHSLEEIKAAVSCGRIAVIVDEKAEIVKQMKPQIVVDAILAKYNTGTSITDAPTVIAIGPGFLCRNRLSLCGRKQTGPLSGKVYLGRSGDCKYRSAGADWRLWTGTSDSSI